MEHPRAPEAGNGRTVDFSRRGLLFRTKQPLRPGDRLEMFVHWPALLSGTCPLQLVVMGRVLRVNHHCAAASIEQYEFRTRRMKDWPTSRRRRR